MFTCERQKLLQEAKVFVKNIPPSVTVNELHDHFATISPQLFVHINTDDKGKRLNFGFVHYLNIEDAETAFEQLQESELRGQNLHLSRWVIKEARQIVQNETRRNLYIRNLPLLKKKVIENSLRQILSIHGEIQSMLIKKVPKLNFYYALVCFRDPQCAQSALKELTTNLVTLEDSKEPLYVSWYQRKTERKVQSNQQLNALYMSNLKTDVTEQALREAFEGYGKVSKVVLTSLEEVNNTVTVKCGYVVFEEDATAEEAFITYSLNTNLRVLFISEPEIELTSYRLSPGNKNKPRSNNKRKNCNNQNPSLNDESFMYWPMPAPYMGNVYQGVYPTYFPMGYYPSPYANPTAFSPMFPNPMFMMPQENMMDRPDLLYIPNESYYDPENKCKAKKNSSLTCTNLDQETRPSSLGSLSSLDGDRHEDSTNTEGHTSSEELDSVESDSKEAKNVTKKETKSQNKPANQTGCKPKRKYGNFCLQRRPILP